MSFGKRVTTYQVKKTHVTAEAVSVASAKPVKKNTPRRRRTVSRVMANEPLDHEQCLELAQLCHAIKRKRASSLQQFIQRNPRERVNLRIPSNQFFRDFMPELVGGTLLHVAYHENDIDAYRLLLSYGADFTMKNADCSTVVHQIVENNYCHDEEDASRGRLKNSFLAATLFAHYEYEVHCNPVSRRGITHLHAACMANSANACHELLSHDADANQAVNVDSTFFPGYTPMHFAARYSELCTLETMRILVKHGADVNAEDASGATPLDLLIDKRAKIAQAMENRGCGRELMKALLGNEKLIAFLVGECGAEGLEMM